MVNFDSPF